MKQPCNKAVLDLGMIPANVQFSKDSNDSQMETVLEWERIGSWEIFEKYCGNPERHEEGLNRGIIPSGI